MYIFDFTEKINFIRQFGLHVEITQRIAFSTILLTTLFLVYLVNFLIKKNINLPNHPYIKYLFIACIFLFILVFIFYPILYIQYKMEFRSDIILLNRIIKFLIIMLVVTNYIDSETKIKRLSIPVAISLGLTAVISSVMIINH
jgi:hypothetical protein